MIVVTGAAGFIGSCLVAKLNAEKFYDLVLVDDFSNDEKNRNLRGKRYREEVHRDHFFTWLEKHQTEVQFIFHIGARTDTTEFNWNIFEKLNINYTQDMWNKCRTYGIPLVYASSAATYGLGELGYEDNEALIPQLQPLNPYGRSKNDFDIWALQQEEKPYSWRGLKFFNVYGPNEYHKGRMASVILHGYRQVKENGKIKLFRSHKPEYTDGGQMRDFVYVKDVVNVLYFLMYNRLPQTNGIYNLGSGKARTFSDLAKNTFIAAGVPEHIEFIDTPEDIRDKYQYFTEAQMQKLQNIGYSTPFHTLEEGVQDYVGGYLVPELYL